MDRYVRGEPLVLIFLPLFPSTQAAFHPVCALALGSAKTSQSKLAEQPVKKCLRDVPIADHTAPKSRSNASISDPKRPVAADAPADRPLPSYLPAGARILAAVGAGVRWEERH
jgi:hypothetical protein